MNRNTFKWSGQRFNIYFLLLYSLYCFQWNKHTNINYWKYHATTICYPYYIIAIVTSPSKRVLLGVRNLMWKCDICRIPLWYRLHTFTANYVQPSGPFCLVRSQLQCSFVLSVITINCHNVRYSYRGKDIPFLIFSEKSSTSVFKNLKLYSNS